MGKTKIEWTDYSLNFWNWVCKKVSPGCLNCYAEALAKRYGKDFGGEPIWRENAVKELRQMKPSESCFVADMSDFFLERVPEHWRIRALDLMAEHSGVHFLILTKRIERAALWQYPENVWLGTSVETQRYTPRIDVLRGIPARGKFLSLEPLLGPIQADLSGMDGVIVGAESGPNRRPFEWQWVRDIREQCAEQGVMFFLKQGSAFRPGMNRELDGRTYDALPWRKERNHAF